jgi:hypothetical protein
MKRKLLTTLSALLITSQAWAALPPYHQRVRELQSVLCSAELSEKVHNEPIEALIFKGEQAILIQTAQKIGPVEFSIKFEDPQLLDD